MKKKTFLKSVLTGIAVLSLSSGCSMISTKDAHHKCSSKHGCNAKDSKHSCSGKNKCSSKK